LAPDAAPMPQLRLHSGIGAGSRGAAWIPETAQRDACLPESVLFNPDSSFN